ncbi:DNA cytosine methyltransferase [uncultured Coprobacter sp.]|uniref:DNA cytosine methyltransferase n=1 Tax=uncultured Coprobacter sp. TaxID=1720550 RepID=UPI00260B3E4B|nr:DNA cytosine methyltransferase [uncultured Coprobacter sp.]
MIKILLGGSPCTDWSIAKKDRETEPKGKGWELFKNYWIAKQKFCPDFFLYENVKSAKDVIKDEIKKRLEVWDGTLLMPDSGARYIEINSALVSAQNRQRFYVHNCGEVGQPKDRGILLKDILESGQGWTDKSYALTTREAGAIPEDTLKRRRHTMVAEPVIFQTPRGNNKGGCKYKKSPTLTAHGSWQENNKVVEPVRVGDLPNASGEISGSQATRIYSIDGKSVNLVANGGGLGAKTGLYACPFEVEELAADYYHGDKNINLFGKIISKNTSNNNGQPAQCVRVYNTANKSICLDGDGRKYIIDSCPNNVEKVKGINNKIVPVYEVRNGLITIKDKQYPIKLKDGFYIIRKPTVTECCRLQTMPDNYCRAVSATQGYRGLGNGWTAEVIIHILSNALKDVPKDEEIVVLSMYDGIGTGRYCLDKMGFTNVKYYAYEIDKFAIRVAMSNYPDIVQCGDAFQVRQPDWKLN